jgi:alkanesulfonate monooxygenase SsuD/methylene tetrahydromethanopterin reductase-like flavin-dependent oxidoreductase (luciferase family)
MKIGMNLPVMVPGLDRDCILEWSRRIDAGPYSSLAAGERITFPNPEIMVTLSAAAAVTERVAIAFTVLVLPMHGAVQIAKQVATLDVISGGRVVLGVGVGGREEDYVAVGAEYDKTIWRRMEDQVELMRRAWAGEQVVEGALRPVEPAPVQPGGPELLAGSMFPRSIRRAARWADGISGFSMGPHPSEISNQFELARRAWDAQGREREPRLVTSFWFALGGPQARADGGDDLGPGPPRRGADGGGARLRRAHPGSHHRGPRRGGPGGGSARLSPQAPRDSRSSRSVRPAIQKKTLPVAATSVASSSE